MTIWTPNLQSREGPRYQALAEAIGEAIASGELPAGSRLPAQRDLAWRLGVTVGTVGRAYLLAEQRGLLSGEVGRGTFVRPPLPAAEAALLGSEPEAAHIDLTHNAPAGGGHGPALAATLTALGRHNDLSGLLGYAPSVGHARHRAAGEIGRAHV